MIMSHKVSLVALKCLAGLALIVAAQAHAYQWGPVDAKVTMIDPTYVGTMSTAGTAYGAIYFMVDQSVGGGTCPAGAYLVWAPLYFSDANPTSEAVRQQANVKAVLATLQLALATGTKVRLYGNNAVGGVCQITNYNSLNQ
jgi:hypothetical protein